MLAADFGGQVTLTYAPTGVVCLLVASADLEHDGDGNPYAGAASR
jgi:hypothetical protein